MAYRPLPFKRVCRLCGELYEPEGSSALCEECERQEEDKWKHVVDEKVDP